jgi:iron complex transport system substrate-binding protein
MDGFKGRTKLLVPVVVIAGLVFSGCKKAIPVSSAYPLKVTAKNGTVTIPHRPSRIISLSPTATDDLFAVGAGKQVVAVDSYSTYPPAAPRTDLSGFTPNVEAIAKYRPDLVVISGDTNGIVAQLAKLSIPTLVEPAAADLDGVYAQLTQIARATGHSGGAESVVAGIRKQVTAIVGSVPKPAKPLAVYHELDQTFFSANSHTFIGQMYKLLGLRNIADAANASTDYPQLSAEYVIAANPDLIVLADTVCCGQTAATVAARPGWSNIAAVKDGGVVGVDDSIASQWGPRIVIFLKEVAAAVTKLEAQSK